MPRTRNVPYTRRRRKKWLKSAKGYWGGKHRLYKTARLQVMKALLSAYRERKKKKRVFRALWITRINAALRQQDLKYSEFINSLKKNNIDIDRKTLAMLAYEHPEEFNSLIEFCRAFKEKKAEE